MGGGAPIYHIWVILSNHHPSQTASHSFSVFFSIPVGQPPIPVEPTRPISLTLTQAPLPQLPAWSQIMDGEPKRGQKDTGRQKGRGAG